MALTVLLLATGWLVLLLGLHNYAAEKRLRAGEHLEQSLLDAGLAVARDDDGAGGGAVESGGGSGKSAQFYKDIWDEVIADVEPEEAEMRSRREKVKQVYSRQICLYIYIFYFCNT